MKKTVIIAIVLVVTLLGAGGYYYFPQYMPNLPMLSSSAESVEEEPEVFPLFLPLKRFVISLDGQYSSRYLVLEVSLMTHNRGGLERLEQGAPLLQNVLVGHFTGHSVEQAKEKVKNLSELQSNLLEMFNQVLVQHSFGQTVEQVIITNVFIQ